MNAKATLKQTEIAIVGAGPAGVSAAITAAQAGAKVTLIDENANPGGQYFKQPTLDQPTQLPGNLGTNADKGAELISGLEHPGIELLTNTMVWGISEEDLHLKLYGRGESESLKADRIIFASGAYERLMPFQGWTLPGVMTAGGAQLMMKSQGILPGQKFLVAGTGPLLQLAAVQLLEAGGEVEAILELQSKKEFLLNATKLWGQWDKLGQGLANQKKLKASGVPIKYRHVITRALGDREVEGAVSSKIDSRGRICPRSEDVYELDTICISYGFLPATELPTIAGCEQFYDPAFGTYATKTNSDLETTVEGLFAIGECRGIGGVSVALIEGQLAGLIAAQQLGYDADQDETALRNQHSKARKSIENLGRLFSFDPGICDLVPDDVPICRCEGVTAGEVRESIRRGASQLNHLKPWHRTGMGRCQGRMCGPILQKFIIHEAGLEPSTVEPFTARMPIKPLPMKAVADYTTEGGETTWEDHVGGYGVARTEL